MSQTRDNTDGLFTATQIARAAGLSKRHVRHMLKGITPDSFRAIRGRLTRVWHVRSLPEELWQRLFKTAAKQGYAGPVDLVQNSVGRWQPPLSTKEVHPKYFDKADKLRRALRPTLNRWDDRRTTGAEKERLGLDEYERVFGHAVTAQHWRKLVKRTRERDRGFKDWDRIEIYLDDRLARAPARADEISSEIKRASETLLAVIANVKNPVWPTRDETCRAWAAAFVAFDECLRHGEKARKLKAAFLGLMWSQLPSLAKNPAALRRAWNRRYRVWKESGGDPESIADQRPAKSGWYRSRTPAGEHCSCKTS